MDAIRRRGTGTDRGSTNDFSATGSYFLGQFRCLRRRARRADRFDAPACLISVVSVLSVLSISAQSAITLRDAAPDSGIAFVLENSPTPQKHLVETIPGGLAAFDYDGDGLPDIYFTNGALLPSLQKAEPKHWNRLYRNLGGLRFSDVTEKAGLAGAGYSMGAAAGDFDNDGNVDLFVAGVRHNLLYRNRGDGTFEDVTVRAGIHSRVWSVAGGWFDYDVDGRLDLFVVNYVHWDPEEDRFCGDQPRGIRVYCHPRYFQGLPNTLYRNKGDGTFEDVSEKTGIARHSGKGMSVAFADYDEDGRVDVFVTNDKTPNFLFRNRSDGTFAEVALTAGAALTDLGKPVSSMGADFRDYDNDGRPDIVVTALASETFPLFRFGGTGFRDATFSSGLAALTMKLSGWSNGLVDLNNDGWKDLFTANAHVNDRIEDFERAAYRQANSVFLNDSGRFADVSAGAGAAFQTARAHRGAAFADFDRDGLVDIVATSLGDRPELWANETTNAGRWITFKLQGRKSNRDGIGAIIRISCGTGGPGCLQTNQMTSAVGYASSSHDGVHFGLRDRTSIDKVEIRWPSGATQTLEKVKADQILKVTEP